jgi:serine/threonine protein kinase/WD40 repeat protein/tetratricopeptide (TPR) repeat protein
MTNSSSESNRLDELAEEFVARHRRGERPSLSEYANKYPELAEQIREVFPALVVMEDVRPQPAALSPASGQDAAAATGDGKQLERLGDYRIIREVGHGGMGIVYEAEQESLGRHVALKVLPQRTIFDPQRLRRFQREARAAARLHHTNIVPVYGVGEQVGLHYYVMQFIQGQGLNEVLEELKRLRQVAEPANEIEMGPGNEPSAKPLVAQVAASLLTGGFATASLGAPPAPEVEEVGSAQRHIVVEQADAVIEPSGDRSTPPPEPTEPVARAEHSTLTDRGRPYWHSVARLGVQVAEALAYAHSQNLLHRDIKPSNLLLDVQGTVWVTDFGLAKIVADEDNLTNTGDIVGTLRYMAPERFAGQSDGRCDIYSLGLTLYEMLTFRPAFDATDRNRLIQQVMHEECPRPRAVNPEVPRDLETIVLKAIDREPTRRYQSAADLAADLALFLEDRPIKARRVRVHERLWRWCRRNPGLATATAAAVVLLIAVTVTSIVAAVQQRQATKREEGLRLDAQKAEADALATNEESRRLLARQYVARGAQLMEQGNLNDALLWYVEALHKDVADPECEAMHRLRIAATAQMCPRPAHLLPHNGPVVKVVVSPDGNRLLTVSGSTRALTPEELRLVVRRGAAWSSSITEARIWDLQTGTLITGPLTMPLGIIDAQFSPDARWVYLMTKFEAPNGCKARVFDAATGQPVTPLIDNRGTASFTAGFSPDSKRLLVLGGVVRREAPNNPLYEATEVQVWDLASGKQAVTPLQPKDPPWSAEFNRDGKRILTRSNATFQLWDAETGRALGKALPAIGGFKGAFSADGTRLFYSDFEDKSGSVENRRIVLRFVDTKTGKEVGAPIQLGKAAFPRLLSPDGKALLVAGPWGVRLVDPESGHTISEIWPDKPEPGKDSLLSHVFSPDGQHLVLNVTDQWDSRTGMSAVGKGIAWVFRGDKLVPMTIGASKAFLWHARTGKVVSVKGTLSWTDEFDFSPDGNKLLVNHVSRSNDLPIKESVEIYDGAQGDQLVGPILHQNQRTHGALSSDNARLLTWGGTEARLWDAATGQPLSGTLPHQGLVLAAAFRGDKPGFVTAGVDGLVRVWHPVVAQVPTARIRPGGHVRGIRLSRNGNHVLVSSGNLITTPNDTQRLWSVERKLPLTPSVENRYPQFMGDFAEDGRVVLTWDEHSVQLWGSETGQPLHDPIKSADKIVMAAVSPRGRRLAVVEQRVDKSGATQEQWARIWDGNTGKPVSRAISVANGFFANMCSFSPDGKRFLLRKDGQLKIWKVEKEELLMPPISCSTFAFSDDGRRLMTASGGNAGEIWDVETGAFVTDCVPACFLAEATKGRMILIREDREAQVHDATTGLPLTRSMSPRGGIGYSGLAANGRFAVTISHPTWRSLLGALGPLYTSDLQVWDASTGEPVVPALPITYSNSRGSPEAQQLQMTPDGRKLVFCSDIFTCDVWELPREERPLEELVTLAQALSGRRVDDSGSTPPLDPQVWLALRARHPETGAVPFDLMEWYSEQAEKGEITGDWQAARAYLDRLIAAQPDVWMHYRRRGRADAELNDWEAALQDDDRAIKRGANIWNVWHNRGIAHLALRHFKQAGDDLEKAADMDGAWPNTRWSLVGARARQGDLAAYFRACNRLLKNVEHLSPPSGVVWACSLAPGGVADGKALIRLAEPDLSPQQGAEANAGARTAIGAARFRAGQYQEAITILSQNEGLHGAYDWLFLAMAHHRLGKEREAVSYLSSSVQWIKAYADDRDQGPVFSHQAAWARRSELKLLREEAAQLMFGPSASDRLELTLAEKEHSLDPDDAQACNYLAWNLVSGPKALRDPQRALALAEKAVTLAPGNWGYHNTLGVTLYRLGRYKDAVAALETSHRHQQGQLAAFNLYFLAMCQHHLGDETRAKEHFESAVRSHEENEKVLSVDQRAELRAFRAEAEELLKRPWKEDRSDSFRRP